LKTFREDKKGNKKVFGNQMGIPNGIMYVCRNNIENNLLFIVPKWNSKWKINGKLIVINTKIIPVFVPVWNSWNYIENILFIIIPNKIKLNNSNSNYSLYSLIILNSLLSLFSLLFFLLFSL